MEAVVFDLDGVVVNTEKYWNMAEKEIYEEILDSEEIDSSELAGMSITNTYNYLSENYEVSVSLEEFFEMYEERAENIYINKAEIMPNLKNLISELREKGLKIGLATGSYWPKFVIKRFDLDFDAIAHSGMIEGSGKPEPETYLLAVKKLKTEPEECIAIDDTDAGISSAKDAGLYCIGYEGSDGQSLSRADETVSNPREFRKRLMALTDTQ